MRLKEILIENRILEDEDNTPASPDESGMAMNQLNFICYAAEEVKEYLQSQQGGFPEWLQNKLTDVHSRIRDIHSYIEGERSETPTMEGKRVNEEIKVGDKVTVNYPTLRKPIIGQVSHVLKAPEGLVYVLKGDNGVWDAKWVSLKESVNEGKLADAWRKNNKKGYVLKAGDIKLKSDGPGSRHDIFKNNKRWGSFALDYEAGGDLWWVKPITGKDFWVKTIDDIAQRVKDDSSFNESVNEASASGYKLLVSVSKGNSSNIEGIKISQELASEILNWIETSAYGRKYNKQLKKVPFASILKAVGGLFGLIKKLDGELKSELQNIVRKYSTNDTND